MGLVFIHTHLGESLEPRFSGVDDAGERVLAEFLERRGLGGVHVALVVGRTGCQARQLGSEIVIRVLQIGSTVEVMSSTETSSVKSMVFDRQIRAFGGGAQARLGQLKVGIVGLGGTGSIVAQQLVHLGVDDYLLIDPDIVDLSNLNRLASADPGDVGASKVEVVKRYIHSVRPTARVVRQQSSVLLASIARLLVERDFVFCCTDTYGSRAVLNQLAYQFFVPSIDMGVSLRSSGGMITHVTGRVQMLAPGLGCLVCGGLLDTDAVRWDLMTDYERQVDPYFIGPGQPAPAVMSLNGTMASLAVTMLLAATVAIPMEARYQIYNGIRGTVRAASIAADPNCIVCSKRGALGRGDEWPLPARRA
jgi:hypothetical protein